MNFNFYPICLRNLREICLLASISSVSDDVASCFVAVGVITATFVGSNGSDELAWKSFALNNSICAGDGTCFDTLKLRSFAKKSIEVVSDDH